MVGGRPGTWEVLIPPVPEEGPFWLVFGFFWPIFWLIFARGGIILDVRHWREIKQKGRTFRGGVFAKRKFPWESYCEKWPPGVSSGDWRTNGCVSVHRTVLLFWHAISEAGRTFRKKGPFGGRPKSAGLSGIRMSPRTISARNDLRFFPRTTRTTRVKWQ